MDTTETRVVAPQRRRISEPNATQEAPPGLSVGQILQMLVKHKWFILGCTLFCALVAAIYAKRATPIFESEATLRIDPGRASSLGLGELGSPGLATSDLSTEIQILQSDRVAIRALNSLPDDVFRDYADAEKKTMYIPAESESLSADQEDLVGKFKGELTVKQVADTQVVSITFRDPSPRITAALANHLVSAYIRESFDSRHGSLNQINTWLSSEMHDLQSQAAEAQDKLARFEEQNGILATEASASGSGANTTTDRLRQLNDRLTAAEGDRIVREAQLRAASAGNQDPAVLTAIFPNSKIQALQGEEVTLSAQYAQLSAKFGSGYGPLAQVKKQLDALHQEVIENVRLIQDQARKEYDTAKTTEDMLRHEYEDQTRKAYALNRQQADLAVLQSQENSSRELYNTLQMKLQQAGIIAGLNGINTLPVDLARVPLYPVAPKKSIILAFGAALGFLIGVGSSLVVEASADKIMGLDQLAGRIKYRSLGLIPPTPKAIGPLVAIQDPLSGQAEAYRRLRNLLLQSANGQSLGSLMITSAQPDEGKGLVASNYAIVLAQTGAKVLLIDAELRRPTLHTHFSVENGVGLSDRLEGDATPAHLVQPLAALPNLFLLTAGKQSSLPAEALASNRFHLAIEEWKGQFEYVVIKSAPLLSVSDSLPLTNWVDGVLIVARQGVSRLQPLKNTQELLGHTHANVVGIVITDATGVSELYGDENAYQKAAHAS